MRVGQCFPAQQVFKHENPPTGPLVALQHVERIDIEQVVQMPPAHREGSHTATVAKNLSSALVTFARLLRGEWRQLQMFLVYIPRKFKTKI